MCESLIGPDGTATEATLEVPVTLLERHPRAAASAMQDGSMGNCIPCGLAAIFDPELASVWPDPAIVQQLVAQLPWSSNILLVQKLGSLTSILLRCHAAAGTWPSESR